MGGAKNLPLRQALSGAVDRDAIVDSARGPPAQQQGVRCPISRT